MYNLNYNYGYPNLNYNIKNINNCKCTKSYFRIFNSIFDSPNLDVYINEMIMASNLKYGEFTKHVLFAPGNYRVTLYPSGSQNGAIFEGDIVIDRNLTYTGALSGYISDSSEISIYMIPEAKENADMKQMSSLRLINLGLDSPSLELVVEDGTILFSNLNYGDISSNIAIPSTRYTLHLRANSKNENILTAPNVDFAPKMHYTLFVIGNYGKTPKMELIIPEDGVNYLDIC